VNLREWVWPQLEMPPDIRTAQVGASIRGDRGTIDAAVFDVANIDVLIEEARRLNDAENARRSGADTRASTYLAIVGVLAPVLFSLAPVAATTDGGWQQTTLSLVLLIAAGAYLMQCGIWCFRVLRVSRFARVDAMDLVQYGAETDPRPLLIRQLLNCVCYNRAGVNEKVTGIKMAHEFGLRALVTFVLAIMVRAAWNPIVVAVDAIAFP